jgi:DNA-binding response OmpR family regulator
MTVAVYSGEEKLLAQLASLLESQGHRVLRASAPAEAAETARAARPQLLVACNASGRALELVRLVRADESLRGMPILCVDPQAGASDTVTMLDAGADDALTRPFQPPVFLARVRVLLRRAVWSGAAPEETVTTLSGGPVELRLIARQALVGGRPVGSSRASSSTFWRNSSSTPTAPSSARSSWRPSGTIPRASPPARSTSTWSPCGASCPGARTACRPSMAWATASRRSPLPPPKSADALPFPPSCDQPSSAIQC